MMQIKGLAGAAGCVAGCAAVFRPSELCLERRAVSDPQAEIDAMEAARARYNETLRRLAGEARGAQGKEGAAIFEAYQVIAEDDYLFDQVKELIRAESVCASWAIEQKRAETEAMFLGVDDPYLQARAADINNVCKEITGELQGVDAGDPFAGLRGEDLIVFAEDLTPADTVRMDRARLKGMVTEKGGVTSHTVILAKALGVKPDAVAGHSLGEFSALVVAGALSFEDGLRLVSKRALAMQAACEQQPGTMAAVLGLEDAVVERICDETEGTVVAANYNCPGQLVISGAVEAVEAACVKAKEAGAKRALRLPVGGAFHSPLMEPAKVELAKAIAEAPFRTPACPIYQNVDAKAYTDPEQIKANLIAQLTAPVRWTYIVKNMLADGVDEFTELGPGTVLQGLVKKVSTEVAVESKATL